jgi:DNA-binding NarL/FixJ family response regulator
MLALAVAATVGSEHRDIGSEERDGDVLRHGQGDLGVKGLLIADANNAFRQALATVLEEQASLGTVAQAVSLAEARCVLPEVDHNLDLAVVSLDLPDGCAAFLIEELRAIGIPVLALTFEPDAQRRARALRAGADEVLGMSSSPEKLVQVASRLVRS